VAGFEEGWKVFLSECATVTDANDKGCGLQLAAQPFSLTNNNRSGSAAFTLSNRAAMRPYSEADIVSCSSGCVLVATGGINEGYAYAPLSFSS